VPATRIANPTEFYAEPRTLVGLHHDHIVDVVDAGRTGSGDLYIAMEYIVEGSLEDVYKGAPAPVATAVRIVSEVCRGAEHAHSLGYIHRDIKPANVLLPPSGAKLSDFGLATRMSIGGTAPPAGYVSHLAPEVVAGRASTVRSDVYAIGVTAYRLVNGDALLPTPISLKDAILNGAYPDRNRFREYVHPRLRRAILRALEVDPGARTPTASDLRHELEAALPIVSWCELPLSATVRNWVGNSNAHDFRATIQLVAGEYDSVMRRASSGRDNWRRVTKDCATFATKNAAERHARSVLQRYATRGA